MEAAYFPLVRGALARLGLAPDVVDETLQLNTLSLSGQRLEVNTGLSAGEAGATDNFANEEQAVINECGYIDTFRAWRRGWPAERIRAVARAHGGLFVLP